MELVYSQFVTLYTIIPHASQTSNDPTVVTSSAKASSFDGVIGAVSKQKSGKQSNIHKSMSNLTIQNSDPPSDKDLSEVNAVQSTGSNRSSTGDQKKGKGKHKPNNARFGKKSNSPANDSSHRKPKFPCLMCGEMNFIKDCPHRENVNCFIKDNVPTTTILTNPFPNQANQVESQDRTSGSTSSQVLMCQEDIRVTTMTKEYTQHEGSSSKHPLTELTPPPNGPLQIERPATETIKPPPKNILRKSAYNPHARAIQSYNIVEDLAQVPLAMPDLEVFQIFPAQRKDLLSIISDVDLTSENVLGFDLELHVPRLPP